ncbi:AFG1-like ATPase-domain-containing protein [Podospora aff. communis PSN243]|uniref:AFG1-like ATPase-domain-containing protein n=1 Tax=Podospora aff. communis PSN243 TaxID=3040156 RepID=A0AAV9GIP8_9PEZI|nr:AFG1-like ATPase-domain-containing protein [Podospora aff. communis PSN243]
MSRATSVTITDPLVKYNSLIATGACLPDASQYRLAHHLQRLYEYRTRLRKVDRAVARSKAAEDTSLASPNHAIRRNPLFARFFQSPESKESLDLVRVLTSHQAALHADSPKGLFLSGEVGTGKSMLLDLLAEGLPTHQKKRWHFNTFMLYALSRLEQFRKLRSQESGDREEYSLLWLAKELVEKSPILFLDEFQLPDRAASKIMNNLFIAFFQLGGVLVASSNRMPEELEKATGGCYSPPPTGGLMEQVLGLRRRRSGGDLFGPTSDFSAFLDVLKARCDFWHMEGARDWRRREVSQDFKSTSGTKLGLKAAGDTMVPRVSQPVGAPDSSSSGGADRPSMYLLPTDSDEMWTKRVLQEDTCGAGTSVWQPSTLIIYGRKVVVPRQRDGVALWDFAELVESLGPADYISLASSYHTFVIENIPVLSMAMKNEARRFITLLDALYEARCKLVVRADAGPDDLFFPETRRPAARATTGNSSPQDEADDATYSETISEVFQDQVSPFRPNVSTYAESRNAKYDPDQDSDFKLEPEKRVDFRKTGAFTGEDERFAYKRATSRLWELCGDQWHARTGDWWQPLPSEARHWEGVRAREPSPTRPSSDSKSEITLGPSVEVEEPAGLERFRVASLRKSQ